MTHASHTTVDPPRHRLSAAWWSLLLFVPAGVAAIVLGEGIPAWLGYDPPALDTTPFWVICLAFGVATVVLALPLLVVSRLSRHAVEVQGPDGRTPFIVASLLVAGFVVINLFGLVAQLLFG